MNIQLGSNKNKTNNELNFLRSENQKLKIDIENLIKELANVNQLNQMNQYNIQKNQINLNEINKLKQ